MRLSKTKLQRLVARIAVLASTAATVMPGLPVVAPALAAGPEAVVEHVLQVDLGAAEDANPGAASADAAPALRASDLVRQALRTEETDRSALGFAKAHVLYCEAARLDDADALMRLGSMYAEGRGVPRDDAIANTLFRRAAGVVEFGDRLPECLRKPYQPLVMPVPARPEATPAPKSANRRDLVRSVGGMPR